MNTEKLVGSSPLPRIAQEELADLMARLDDLYVFKNGATAAYWHMTLVLSEHIVGGRQ